jgi:hypothetical protein
VRLPSGIGFKADYPVVVQLLGCRRIAIQSISSPNLNQVIKFKDPILALVEIYFNVGG